MNIALLAQGLLSMIKVLPIWFDVLWTRKCHIAKCLVVSTYILFKQRKGYHFFTVWQWCTLHTCSYFHNTWWISHIYTRTCSSFVQRYRWWYMWSWEISVAWHYTSHHHVFMVCIGLFWDQVHIYYWWSLLQLCPFPIRWFAEAFLWYCSCGHWDKKEVN